MSDLTPEEQAIADQAAADQAAADDAAAATAAAKPVKPAAKKPVAQKAQAKAAAPSGDYPAFLQSTTQFPYVDPDSGIRFSPGAPIKVDVAPEEGSWLHSQIEAGLIAKA